MKQIKITNMLVKEYVFQAKDPLDTGGHLQSFLQIQW